MNTHHPLMTVRKLSCLSRWVILACCTALIVLCLTPSRVATQGGAKNQPAAAMAMAGAALAVPLSSVDNSKKPYFPSIRSQGALNSSAAFAATYYTMTYMTARARNIDVKAAADEDTVVFSPKWSHNLVNNGADVDSADAIPTVYNLLYKHGAATWAEVPYDGVDYTSWCSDPAVWGNAIGTRILEVEPGKVEGVVSGLGVSDSPTSLPRLKEMLAAGYVLNFASAVDSWKLGAVKDDPNTPLDDAEVDKDIAMSVSGTSARQALTVVGYNDDIWVDIDGDDIVDAAEKGALRIANSRGTGWGDGGFTWFAYDALNSTSGLLDLPVDPARKLGFFQGNAFWMEARPSYTPTLLARVTLNQAKRQQIGLTLGRSTVGPVAPTTTWTPYALNLGGGNLAFDGTTTAVDGTFYLDFTDIDPNDLTLWRWYLQVKDNLAGDETNIKEFRLIDVKNGGRERICDMVLKPANNSVTTLFIDYSRGPQPQPDLLARADWADLYLGDGVYGVDGENQVIAGRAPVGTAVTYHLRAENDTMIADSFLLKAPALINGWTIQYFNALTGGTDITTEVTGTGWNTGALEQGQSVSLRVVVTPTRDGAAIQPFVVSLGSVTILGLKDAITLKTSRTSADTFRVSVDSDEVEGNQRSTLSAISGNGRYVAFESLAGNLVTDDHNGKTDIFLRDYVLGTTERVSKSKFGAEGNGDSTSPAMSADGRFIAFASTASNLVAGDTNGKQDVFVYDRQLDALTRVSVSTSGYQANGDSYGPSISADGSTVGYVSEATNLIFNDTNARRDVFVRTQTGQTLRVSLTDDGMQADGHSGARYTGLALSADGSKVAFTSYASNLVTDDTNTCSDVFVRDRSAGTTIRVSVADDGSEGDDASFNPSITADGTLVAFCSRAKNLVPDDLNGREDVFLYNITTSLVLRVSQSSTGVETTGDAGLYGLALSGNGQYLVYHASAPNLVTGDTNGKEDIFLYEVLSGRLRRISVNADGIQANDGSRFPAINADGRFITFASLASNLVADDANDVYDVFLYERGTFYQPDLQVKKSADTTYLGGNIYRKLDEQTVEGIVTTGEEAVYHIKLENDSDLSDTVRVQGSAGTPGWNVQYFYNTTDISSAVKGGGWTSPNITAHNSIMLIVKLRTFASLPSGAPEKLVVTATSKSADTRQDQVAIETTLKPAHTVRASIATDGTQNGNTNRDPVFSANGQYVAFESDATTLIAGDANGQTDIFVHNRKTGETKRVSLTYDGKEAGKACADADISGDGTRISFKSTANLAEGVTFTDTTPTQIYLRDTEQDTTILVSKSADGLPANGACDSAVMSFNGRYVAYCSSATNLIAEPVTGKQVYRYDITTGETILISKGLEDLPANAGCESSGINDDGNVISWRTTASNLVVGDTNAQQDIFVRDVELQVTERASVVDANTQISGASGLNSRSPLSGDGRYVCFISMNAAGKNQVFVRDRNELQTVCVSLKSDGTVSPDDCTEPTISADGRFVGFKTLAPLVANDNNGKEDVYVTEWATGTPVLVSLTHDEKIGNGKSYDPFISEDGRYIIFEADATNLVPNDANANPDIFIRDVWLLQPDLMIRAKGGVDYVGAGLTNNDGDKQVASQFIVPGHTVRYELRVENGEKNPDTYTITGTDGGDDWSVKYFDVNELDITAAVLGNGWQTPELLSDEGVVFYLDVTADERLMGAVQKDIKITATSNASSAMKDRVIASTTTEPERQPDLQVRTRDEFTLQGDNLYNVYDGQTAAQSTAVFNTAVYTVKIENDGGSTDSFVITGLPGDTGWSVNYIDPVTGFDITDAVTGDGWQTLVLPVGGAQELRVEVTPDNRPVGNTTFTVDIAASSLAETTKSDVGRLITTVEPFYRPDGYIHDTATNLYVGENSYLLDGSQFSKQTVMPGSTAIFRFRVQNDGNVTDSNIVKASAGDANWVVRYFNASSGGTDITDAVTSVDGWTTSNRAPGFVQALRVEVTPVAALNGGMQRTVSIRLLSSKAPEVQDLIRAIIETKLTVQPDGQIRKSTETSYIGNNIYNNTALQTKTQAVKNGVTAVYHLRLENDGNATESFRVSALPAPTGWRVRYYDALVGGYDITYSVTYDSNYDDSYDGWRVYLARGASRDILVEITPEASLVGGSSHTEIISMTSISDTKKTDAVRAVTTVAKYYQPDLQLKQADEYYYTGGGIYNTTGANQTKQLSVAVGQTCVYQVALENDGNTSDTYVLKALVAPAGWMVRYFDDRTYNTEITAQVTASGWLTPELAVGDEIPVRIEVTPEAGLAGSVRCERLLTAISVKAATVDAVKVINTLLPTYQPDVVIRGADETISVGEDVYTGEQPRYRLVYPGQVATFHVIVQNDGNVADTFGVTASVLPAGWTGLVLDGRTGANITSAVTGAGWTTPTLAAGERYLLRVLLQPQHTVASGTRASMTIQATSKKVASKQDRVLAVGLRAGRTTRFGFTTTGLPTPSESRQSVISEDGNWLAFISTAATLVAGDTNGCADVFVSDRHTGATTRVSVATDGTEANRASSNPAISADGRYVAFVTAASNLVEGDVNHAEDVFLHDRNTGKTVCISRGALGIGNLPSGVFGLDISADGRFITYQSEANNLVAADTNSQADIFVYDSVTGLTQRVNITDEGGQAYGASSFNPVVSNDGRYVAFQSAVSTLVPGDTNNRTDIFYYDRTLRTMKRITVPVTGGQANDSSYRPLISADGRYVAFESWATNLVLDDTNGTVDVFVIDMQQQTISRVSVAQGVEGNGPSKLGGMTPDGEMIIFQSGANNLVPNDANTTTDIFLVKRSTGYVERISISSDGYPTNGESLAPTIDGSGRYVAFESRATNLSVGDTNGVIDTFIRDRGTASPLTGVKLTVDPAADGAVGRPITLTAQATGGMYLEYRFRVGYQYPDGIWRFTELSTPLYQGNATVTWTPTEARTYMIRALVREAGSTAYADVSATYNYTVKPAPPISAVKLQLSAGSIAAGQSLTMTANVTGGYRVEYRFRVGYEDMDGTWKWQELSSPLYQTGNTCTWKPEYPRAYILSVLVREAGSTASYEVYDTVDYTVQPATTLTGVVLEVAPTTATVGQTVTLRALATGGAGLEYRFRAGYKDGTGVWRFTELSSPVFQTGDTCTWTPQEARTYTLYTFVRELGSPLVYDVATARAITVAPATL